MATGNRLLIIGIGGHAVAVDPSTGSEIWRTKLKGSDFVTVSPAGQQVFAGAGGELFCLDVGTGRILWHNKLKGLGTGVVTFSASDDAAAVAALVTQRRAAAAAAGAASA
jgi:outer membrane protein assembly factor BamB